MALASEDTGSGLFEGPLDIDDEGDDEPEYDEEGDCGDERSDDRHGDDDYGDDDYGDDEYGDDDYGDDDRCEREGGREGCERD